ncbi:MAG TPA: TadE family protein [Bryobacteraceae bacterium]|nr:TadE family protein [Bryobacteraceae bacterium]
MRPARTHRGGVLVEAALFVPVFLMLLLGTIELGKVAYTYYMLEKVMYNFARYLGTQQGTNFCDSGDPNIVAAAALAVTGTTDASALPIVNGLTPGMLQVQIERFDAASQQVVPCDCSVAGCDASQGGQPPDFITVSLTDGYTVHPLFWGFQVDPFPLRPEIKVPYGGT